MPSWNEILSVLVLVGIGYMIGYFELLKIDVIKKKHPKESSHRSKKKAGKGKGVDSRH
ncbi:unnamed protein product [Meloidogyne enterolobii]|uniref:Uncharacterized protein n=3 Tax=Meloidogyne TaxID=189290 RepID=A0A6V7WY61_MELEN|nr:unnamed protein product [Meloidogyne enterolobii]CAD2191965.1 unnamed protein product [Meloidogyne enterolobii]CAD2194195.1 unnamed protein product [Meloidogyne enterolobii]